MSRRGTLVPLLRRVFRAFGDLYRENLKTLAGGYAGMTLSILVALALPWPLKLILDQVVLDLPFPEFLRSLAYVFRGDRATLLTAFVAAFALLHVLATITSYLHRAALDTVGERMTAAIRRRLFARIQSLPINIVRKHRAGDLVVRFTSDANQIRDLLVRVPDRLIHRTITIVAHAALMIVLEWRLALLALPVIPALAFATRHAGRRIRRATKEKKARESELASLTKENVTAAALVQAYQGEESRLAQFGESNRQSLETTLRALRLSRMFGRAARLLVAGGTAAVVFTGGWLALGGEILPGTIVLFVSYLRNIYRPVARISEELLGMETARVAAGRLLDLYDAAGKSKAEAHTPSKGAPIRGAIRFEDVSFAYAAGTPVLRDLSFGIEPGERVAIAGRNGAGKSTLLHLIVRLHEVVDGTISLDDRPLPNFSREGLSERVSIVFQDSPVLRRTVAANITFGCPEAGPAAMRRAATLAGAEGFIMELPEGYDTIVGEGGLDLSVGQRRRIHLARIILRAPRVVLLDEPALGLDERTALAVDEAIRVSAVDATIVVVSHRPEIMAGADRVLFLEEGRLVASGTHRGLLGRERRYAGLFPDGAASA